MRQRGVELGITGAALIGIALLHPAATLSAPEQVIHMTARKFAYSPSEITVKKGVPVVLDITSLDRAHGFKIPALGVRADVKPGTVTRVRLVPQKTGTFPFHCDVFCGGGHEDMGGVLIVVE